MKEDKQKILDLLLPALQATSALYDLVSLKYIWCSDYEEYVVATFQNGHMKKVNVSVDSGYAMILDVLRHTV